jgi:uncharacterized SAM-binding protein YcdF (DUF218 family)
MTATRQCLERKSVYHFLVWNLCQPYPLLLLALGLLLIRAWFKRWASRRRLLLLTVPFVLLVLVSNSAVAYLALGSLEWRYPPLDPRPADTEVIVVLASSVAPAEELRPRAELDDDGRVRCLHAALLYREGPPCKVLVSGGSPDPEHGVPTCASVMRDFLVEVGVSPADVIVEEQSQSTHENAVACARILKERNLREVVLVMDAVDMARASRCFRKQGVEAVPAPCHYRAATRLRMAPELLLPNPGAVQACQRVAHEWLGMVWYWMRDRI